ncbi:MAG: hypothetical protein IPK19_28840 [Chloroflexi bacterium]|nr:hypothetical protein [Chloroflexota bacterium]
MNLEILLTPPLAFLIYLGAAGALIWIGRRLAGDRPITGKRSAATLQTSTYAGGEAQDHSSALLGYRSAFVIALFFAVLHVGILMLGSGGVSTAGVIYLIGLMVTLLALVLG